MGKMKMPSRTSTAIAVLGERHAAAAERNHTPPDTN